ncbi:MAG: GAF and ANTAR domain-containing protein [Pseudonocardia sp.]|nr:GAF and ANTAR domain-containing protein [Pseudonocardia sp.]
MNGQREQRVTEEFVALADTLVVDFDVIDLLYRLAESCVELLGVAAAGLLLSDQRGNLTPIAATEGARVVELIQLQNDEGPCLECFGSGAAVTCTDLTGPEGQRWPRFTAQALHEGFRSVHALPLRLRQQTIGALNLFGDTVGALPANDLRLGQGLADVATIAILQERAVRRGEVVAEQLQGALNSRIIIEQAKGLLTGRSELTMDQAFERLRSHARSHHLRLSELARDVVTGAVDIGTVLGSPQTAGPPDEA